MPDPVPTDSSSSGLPAPEPQPNTEQRFDLAAPPPVRALAIAAALSLVAVVLLAVGLAAGAPVALSVVAAIVLACGLLLGIGALVLTRGLRTTCTLDDQALVVRRCRREVVSAWKDIQEVGLTGGRLVLSSRTGARTTIVIPRTVRDPAVTELLLAIRARLNANRGYGGPVF